MNLIEVRNLISELKCDLIGKPFKFRLERDCKDAETGRPFVQVTYEGPCSVTGWVKEWHGRKWYLSDHMTEDEIVKTCFAAFKAAVEHEIMEGFTWRGVRIFNPHASFRALADASKSEIYRDPS